MISVVIPLFNEEETVPELCRRITAQLDASADAWELILVNDGSSEECSRQTRAAHAADCRVKVIELSRNFGHQQALSAGIAHASGDCVIVMDGDLQDPPEVIPELLAKWREG